MSTYTADFFMSPLARNVSYNQVFLTQWGKKRSGMSGDGRAVIRFEPIKI